MSKRDLLCLGPITKLEIGQLIKRAGVFKKGSRLRPLSGRSVGLLFEKSSTRTRVSFEVAVWRLGGLPIFLSFDDIQIKRGETIADTARVLSGYLDALVIRTYEQEKLEEWRDYATIPVINGLTDLHHPCQVLSDLFTIKEKKGRLKGLKLVYVGDGNNMAHSLLEGGAKVGMEVVIASPKAYMPDLKVVKLAQDLAKKSGGAISVLNDPLKAVAGADMVYTDVWVSMGQEAERKKRLKILKPYQMSKKLLAYAKPDVMVMHCLPAHRGEEITADVMEDSRSVIFEQAANRLPMQQAILEMCIGKK